MDETIVGIVGANLSVKLPAQRYFALGSTDHRRHAEQNAGINAQLPPRHRGRWRYSGVYDGGADRHG
jgi:hypothetical protein